MKQKIILLYSKEYSITDENTNKKIEGITSYYLFSEDLKPVFGTDGSLGLRPAKANLGYGKLSKLSKVPAIYDGTFEMSVDANGKPMLKLVDVDFIEEFVAIPPFKK